MAKTAFKTVDDYLKTQSKEGATTLENWRESIQKLFPHLKEGIHYQIPSFEYKGKPLVSYAGYKNHCGFYINSMKTARELKPELKNVEVKGVTIQFGFNENLPQLLLKKIIKARMQEIDEIMEAKQSSKSVV